MKLFQKKKPPLPIPKPFTAQDIRTEASTCTGERTIGFYDSSAKRLRYAELVHTEQDVVAFCAKYGVTLGEADLQRLMKE